jgi:hypothetical protein
MFGVFGAKAAKKTNLIKSLVRKRIEAQVSVSREHLQFIESIGRFSALSLPEAEIVVIIEAVFEGKRLGMPLVKVLEHQEFLRKLTGRNELIFGQIIQTAATDENSLEAVEDYCRYRNFLNSQKNPSAFIEPYLIREMVKICYAEISSW